MTLNEYKKFVKKRLSGFTRPLLKISMGDYSVKLSQPKKEDEFSELQSALHITINELADFDKKRKNAEAAQKKAEIEKIGDLKELLGDYKKYVAKKLEELIPIFQKIAIGDFSVEVELPKEEDEFTPLIASLSMVLDDLRFLDKENKKKNEELEEAKKTLEIKVGARTKELKILTENLEKKVEERTEELQSKLEELEKNKKALTNILEDVAEARINAEEEKKKTLAIITNLADGLLVFDKDSALSLINSQAEMFFGVSKKEIVGRSLQELSLLPNFAPLIDILNKKEEKVSRKELFLRENFTLEISTAPIVQQGKESGFLVIIHDITREKFIERMKTEFVSLAAHQLRTPLSAIKWTLKMLLDGDLGKITDEQRNFIEKTYASNERMIGLINDLLDVMRIEEGRYLYKPVLADMEDIVQFVINSYQDIIERKKIVLDFKKSEKSLPKVLVDVGKMRLVIQNFIDNAIKYTPSGGMVTIYTSSSKREVEFSIKDTGMGIPKDQQGRVFSKFFRGANIQRTDTEGSGLGLFITKNIVEAHSGKVWFESEEGRGTTFHFSLPSKEEFTDFIKEF